uniref:Uncharacterized protein n=1 Tax=Lates calcarifer TaxID=8187 RepID=A0A4W6FAC0_LATCA
MASDKKAQAVKREGLEASLIVPETLDDVIDRPGKAFATGTYAGAGKFEEELEDGDQSGAYAAAGVGYARAELSAFDAEAKGPNASAGVSAGSHGAKIFAKAELASASASAGPLKAKVGLAADTGVGVGPEGIEAKVLGTGVSIGRKIGISVLGTGFEFKLW